MGNVYIQKRGKVYQYQFAIAPVNGKRKYINKSGFRTKSEAIEAGNKAYNEYKTAGVPFKECNISYSDYLDYWLENYCKVNLKYNTIQSYKSLINKYIKPKIGMYKLSTITSVGLNTYISNLCEEYDFSRSYFKNILKVVKGSFRDACTKYGLIKYDPAIQLRLPKMDKYEEDIKHLYSKEEIERILERFKDNSPFTCAFLTSCFTGMRTGEVFALTWDDIDFENKIIDVKHSIYDKPKDIKGRWYIGTTKTIGSSREVYICDTLYSVLSNYKNLQVKYKKEYGKKYKRYTLKEIKNKYGKLVEYKVIESNSKRNRVEMVFARKDGTYSGTDIIRYPFRIIHHELGIQCRFYDLRGNFATICLRNGCEIKDIAEILGHKRIETTQKYYILSLEENKKKVTEVFEDEVNKI